VIEALVRLGEDERRFIHGFSAHPLRNWNDIEVGALRASVGLRETLATWS
jgi:hypothetical protein